MDINDVRTMWKLLAELDPIGSGKTADMVLTFCDAIETLQKKLADAEERAENAGRRADTEMEYVLRLERERDEARERVASLERKLEQSREGNVILTDANRIASKRNIELEDQCARLKAANELVCEILGKEQEAKRDAEHRIEELLEHGWGDYKRLELTTEQYVRDLSRAEEEVKGLLALRAKDTTEMAHLKNENNLLKAALAEIRFLTCTECTLSPGDALHRAYHLSGNVLAQVQDGTS